MRKVTIKRPTRLGPRRRMRPGRLLNSRAGWLPPLVPATPDEADLQAVHAPDGRCLRLTTASACDEPTDFRRRSEAHDPLAALTVYAMNAAVMLFAFPVGFGLLIFNILGGENLRTTAHAMGLTGLASALPLIGFAVPVLT